MSTFALIHGAGVGGGWFWHLVEAELRSLGHTTVAPTLWTGDDTDTLSDYADAVVNTIDTTETELFVVAHSFGGFTAPLVAERLPTAGLIYVTAMVPRPGESPADWWEQHRVRGGGPNPGRQRRRPHRQLRPIRVLLPRRAQAAGRPGVE